MTDLDRDKPRDPDRRYRGDDESTQSSFTFILPEFVSAMGYSCAREWAENSIRFQCGCPRCLRKLGLTLIFNHQDWNESGDCQEQWRKLIVSAKTAGLVSHLVIPGYE